MFILYINYIGLRVNKQYAYNKNVYYILICYAFYIVVCMLYFICYCTFLGLLAAGILKVRIDIDNVKLFYNAYTRVTMCLCAYHMTVCVYITGCVRRQGCGHVRQQLYQAHWARMETRGRRPRAH